MPQFSAEAIRVIRQVVRDYLREGLDLTGAAGVESNPLGVIVGKANGTITARSGATPGSGNIDVQAMIAGAFADHPNSSGTTVSIPVKSTADDAITNGSYVVAVQDQVTGCFYTLVASSSQSPAPTTPLVIARCDTGQALLPGDTSGKTFSKYTWNGTSLVDSGMDITVKDPLNCNCYLDGEYGYFQAEGSDYLPVGSHGLFRMAEADANIANGATGTGQFYINGAVSTVNVTIANTYPGYNRQMEASYNDRAFIAYDRTQSAWVALPPQLAMFATAITSDNMIPGQSSPGVTSFGTQDWDVPSDRTGVDDAPTAGEMNMLYDWACSTSKNILLWRKTDTRSSWYPIDSEKVQMSVVEDLRHDNNAIQSELRTQCWLPTVDTSADWTNEITTHTQTVGVDLQRVVGGSVQLREVSATLIGTAGSPAWTNKITVDAC